MSGNGSTPGDGMIALLERYAVPVEPSGRDVMAARSALSAAIAEEKAAPRRVWWKQPAWIGSGAVAIAAAVIALFVIVSVPAPPASAVLENLATVVEAQDPFVVPDGSFAFVESDQEAFAQFDVADRSELETVEFILPEHRRVWIARDGSRVVERTVGTPRFFDAATEAEFERLELAEEIGVGTVVVERFGPVFDELDPDLISLEPSALAATLRELTADDPRPAAASLLELAGDLLIETDASPELRGAVLRFLATVDGLDIIETSSRIDVSAVFEAGGSDIGLTLTFDPVSGDLLERSEVAIDGFADEGIPPGTALVRTQFSPPQVVSEFGP